MALPGLQATLLSEILNDLPDETQQVEQALLAISAKYRADLHAQLQATHKFQEHVTKTHEKVHRKMKRTTKVLEDHNRRLKVDVASLESGRRLCDDVEALSKEVMGKLMNVVEILTEDGTNVDGDKYPLLKRVVGQEGFEVVEIPDTDTQESQDDAALDSQGEHTDDVPESTNDEQEMTEMTSFQGEGEEETTAPSEDSPESQGTDTEEDVDDSENDEQDGDQTIGEVSGDIEEATQDIDFLSITQGAEDGGEGYGGYEQETDEEEPEHEMQEMSSQNDRLQQVPPTSSDIGEGNVSSDIGEGNVSSESYEDALSEAGSNVAAEPPNNSSPTDHPSNTFSSDSTKDTPNNEIYDETNETETQLSDSTILKRNESELFSLESTINKYKASKLKTFPPPTLSFTSQSQSVTTASTASVQGITYSSNSRTALNESLKKFI